MPIPKIWLPDAPPESAGAADDEFLTVGAGVPSGWSESDFDASITVSVDAAGLVLLQTTSATRHRGGIYKAIPAGDFTIWAKVSLLGLANTASIAAGLALWLDATSSSTDLVVFNFATTSGQTLLSAVEHADPTASAGTDRMTAREIGVDVWPTHMYQRIRRNGTTYAYDFSTDGIAWQRGGSAALGFTPAHMGLFMNNFNTGADAVARFPFFRYVASDVGITGKVGGDVVDVRGQGSRLLLGVG